MCLRRAVPPDNLEGNACLFEVSGWYTRAMCGRYTHLLTWRQIVELYGLLDAVAPNDFAPRYNIAPTQKAPVVRNRDGWRECVTLRWGLIPFWAKDAKIAYKTINARSETVPTAPSYRAAFKARRCLIPMSGFYEWQKTPGGKQPYLIGFKDGRPFSFAGLWESWKDQASGETIETYTIITGEPNAVAGKIHNRMPVIVDPADFGRWLTASEPPTDLLKPYPTKDMTAFPVSKAVGSPKNDRPELIERVEAL
jgi:putative SOS response-associated peptidase YedK